jgi:hypothetical protein
MEAAMFDNAEMGEFASGARDGVKVMKAFLTYQGDNPDYYKKARIGAVLVGSYTRLRSSQANLASLVLSALQKSSADPKAIKETCRAIGLLPEANKK